MSEYARMVAGAHANGHASRYRGENIMRLSLDRGGRTTRDYEGPTVAPKVQAALDAAMLNLEPGLATNFNFFLLPLCKKSLKNFYLPFVSSNSLVSVSDP